MHQHQKKVETGWKDIEYGHSHNFPLQQNQEMMSFVAISSLSNVKKRKLDGGLSHTNLKEENGGI